MDKGVQQCSKVVKAPLKIHDDCLSSGRTLIFFLRPSQYTGNLD